MFGEGVKLGFAIPNSLYAETALHIGLFYTGLSFRRWILDHQSIYRQIVKSIIHYSVFIFTDSYSIKLKTSLYTHRTSFTE